MNRFATGILSFVGGLLATLIHGVAVTLLDLGLAQVIPLLPSSRENDFMMACVISYVITFSLGAAVAHLFVRFYHRKLPRVNEPVICWWLMFRIASYALSSFNAVGSLGYEQSFFYAIGAAVAVFVPSYAIIWRSRKK